MPQFSVISKARLDECHQDLQRLFYEVVKGFDCTVICGHRSQVEQKRLLLLGKTKVLVSKHNATPAMAVDVAPYHAAAPHVRWEDVKTFYLFVGYVKGVAASMGIKIRCGADWDSDNDINDQSFNDLPHFELVG